MMKMAAMIALAPLAACATPMDPASVTGGGMCGNDNLYRLNGLRRSPAVEKTAREVSGARTVRWIEPGMAVTMDYREDRLSVTVDAEGRITAARCG